MKPIILFFVFVFSITPLAFSAESKTLDTSKFKAPGSQSEDLKAPENDIDKGIKVVDPAVRTGSLPLPPHPAVVNPAYNNICPENYYCVKTGTGYICQADTITPPSTNVPTTRNCRALEPSQPVSHLRPVG